MAFLEVYDVAGSYKVELDALLAEVGGDSLVLGRSSRVDIAISDDEVSRRHLELRPLRDGWTIEDLGSRNGTQVNGDELMKRSVLHAGDEIRVGSTLISFRDYSDFGSSTGKGTPAPVITKTERAVLVELCRPYFGKTLTKGPATRNGIADALCVGPPAVTAHFINLHMKFDIVGDRADKRQLLAEEVIRRGVITSRDYTCKEQPTSG